jgi:hypothetical protein
MGPCLPLSIGPKQLWYLQQYQAYSQCTVMHWLARRCPIPIMLQSHREMSSCHPFLWQLATYMARISSAVGTQVNNDGNVENSGCGRHKRAPHQIGALNGCLCGIVVDPNVNLGDAIQCRQAGCENHWVCFIFPYKG